MHFCAYIDLWKYVFRRSMQMWANLSLDLVSQSVYFSDFNVRIIQSFMFRPIHVDIQSSREKRQKMLSEREYCCMYLS